MSRFIKKQMVKQYRDRFEGVSGLAVIDTQGVDVEQMTALRSTLRDRGVQAMVVQNRLCRLALAEVGLADAAELVAGPSTLVWGEADLVDIAKVLADEADDVPQLEVRGGYLEGRVLSSADMEALSKMPGREQLIAMAVGRVLGQVGRVVSLATAPVTRILGQVREIEGREEGAAAETDQGEDTEGPAAESAAPAEEEKEAEAPAQAAEEAEEKAEAPDEAKEQAEPSAETGEKDEG